MNPTNGLSEMHAMSEIRDLRENFISPLSALFSTNGSWIVEPTEAEWSACEVTDRTGAGEAPTEPVPLISADIETASGKRNWCFFILVSSSSLFSSN